MIKNKKIIIAIIATFILIPAILLFFLPKEPRTPGQKEGALPTIPSGISPSREALSAITRVFPEEDLKEEFLPIQQAAITFSNYISSEELIVEINPTVQIKIANSQNNPNTIVISPDPVWKVGITEIKISKVNRDGKTILGKDFNYKINTNFPKNPPDVE